MLPQQNRVLRGDLLNKKLKFSTWAGNSIKIKYSLDQLPNSKFCVIASKKTYLTKPNRNLFKRRFFHLIQTDLHKIELGPHGFFLCFPLIHISKITQNMLRDDVSDFVSFLSKHHVR